MEPPADREIQIWAVELRASGDVISRCRSWLSADEQGRAGRFHFERHSRAFILGRAVLRALLGGLLEIPPGEVRFSYGPKGKPALADSGCALRFNCSNSANLAVYAFTHGCEIGIDVEALRPIPDMEKIAARFFAAEEAGELMALAERDRPQAFFNCWTRKEAYIKAVGEGLAVPLSSFRVTLRPGVPAEMLSLGGSAEAAQAWTLEEFAPAPGFVGALAYRDQPRPLHIRPMVTAEELLSAVLKSN